MPSSKHKEKVSKNSRISIEKNIKIENDKNDLKFIKRTIENNTHEDLQDTKLKRITSWRKSEAKFLQNLIYNILTLGIIHIISLFYPNLYIKLYCNPWPAKECDYFLVENIYGELTLCTKIHKKDKNHNIYNSETLKENMPSSTLINYNNKTDHYLTKNLTYSFKYKSVTYEYNEETNEIIPVYMNLSKMTNKEIYDFFNEGLSSENLVTKFNERYGKNEYYINFDIIHFYFKKIEINYFILIILTKLLDLFSGDVFSFILSIIFIFSILILEFIVTRIIVYNSYEKEYTLDGEKKKLKVKRKHMIDNNSNFYYEIKNCDLLPGDIIFLKSNDFAPCDCLILEGQCVVNENNLTGSLDIFKKKYLENNNEKFNYKLNKINILYHGMKIVKTFSKTNQGYISALCINTGPNTYKANKYSNILNLLERKKEYKEMYNIFGEGRGKIIFIMISIFFFSILLGLFYMYNLDFEIDFSQNKKLLLKTFAKVISKSFMPVYFLTNSIILNLSVINLKNENIFCFEKFKLLSSSTINTIFFSKSGTLCENNFEINGFHPIYINPHKPNIISYRTYNINQYKEMNLQLLKYYRDYLYKIQNHNFKQEMNVRHGFKLEHNQYNEDKMSIESWECTTLFLECLLSCNNLEKNNIELFGNTIEKEIFLNMRWELKPYIFSRHRSNDKDILDNKNDNFDNGNHKYFYDNNYNVIDNRINDIYPNNYYKITESLKKEIKSLNKHILTRLNSKYYLEIMKKNNNTNISNSINNTNFIKTNVIHSHINSYKLRIFKRFIKYGTLSSSAIVFNFITRELRFTTKGMPEDILDKCNRTTLPDNFDYVISLFRRRGFIVIICAFKIISLDDYKESNSIDYYMEDLTFCGFITLRNKLKKEIINSIQDLKQFNCNLIISTVDNIYNSLSVAFGSCIIENKNIFSFDKDDKKNKIIIAKIYTNKKINEEQNDLKTIKSSLDVYSKQTSKLSNKIMTSPLIKQKESIILNNKNFSLNSFTGKNSKVKQNEFSTNHTNIDSEKRGINNENNNKKIYYKGNIRNRNRQTSKNLINYFNKNNEKEITRNERQSYLEDSYNDTKEYSIINNKTPEYKKKKLLNEKYDNRNSSINKKNDINTNIVNKNFSYLEKYEFYPGIFEDNEDLENNCIYCISGRAFNFLYKNKQKKQCKYLLEKMHKYCKIYFCMSSLDKSLVIDFYREFPNNCICQIGECQSDYDCIMTSHIGINLKAPKNINTILCHFYSGDSNILSIKKIIREGRAVSENNLLLKISCAFYSMILNSYIICCFARQVEVLSKQLNLLEFCFLIMSISSFTAKYDHFINSNKLIQNKKLYICHYITQMIGIFIIKFITIYFECKFYIGNYVYIEQKKIDIIYCSYYFSFCIEQLISTIFAFNLISFYRKSSLTNIFLMIFCLMIFLYFIILTFLSSSNFKYDIFNITYFEFLEKDVDSFDDNNKLKSFIACITDLFACIIYSKIIYFIFDKLANHRN